NRTCDADAVEGIAHARVPEPLDLDSGNDTEELDLLHHPNYAATNNNRRRRRRRIDELAKEEVIAKGSSRSTPLPQLKSEPIAEPDGMGRDSLPAERTSLPEPVERTGKPLSIKSSKEVEPPEVIAIEMTPEEQDVYAFMGISPLVRLERDIKNPKSLILSVVLPGEAPQTSISVETSVESSGEPFAEDSNLSGDFDEEEIPEPILVTTLPPEAPATEIPIESTATSESSESDGGSTIVRRRRRRSSAIENDD
ncbi:MAG: ribonuclease E/G, partial [Coleofasciculus sp. S288]|nr:ribonuclease E/G [Coleofasciculus sp. S288]